MTSCPRCARALHVEELGDPRARVAAGRCPFPECSAMIGARDGELRPLEDAVRAEAWRALPSELVGSLAALVFALVPALICAIGLRPLSPFGAALLAATSAWGIALAALGAIEIFAWRAEERRSWRKPSLVLRPVAYRPR